MDMIGQLLFGETTPDFQDYAIKASYQKGSTLDEVKLNWEPEDILPKAIKNIRDL